MRVLVCGGRDYSDKDNLYSILDKIHEKYSISVIIQGCASGADWLAAEWAFDYGIDCEYYPADWDTFGKTAGLLRNQQMLNTKPDLVVAFPGGKGTAHMINISKAAGVEVIQI